MSFQLVITEKPSVARSIATVIGPMKSKTATGRATGILSAGASGIWCPLRKRASTMKNTASGSMKICPSCPSRGSSSCRREKQQFEIVRSLLNRPDVDSVTAATDAGREGELIFRFVYQMAGCTKPVKRLWISSMEDAAIREALQTCARIRIMMLCINRPSAVQRRIGWWASMQHGCFRCCITNPDGSRVQTPTLKCWWTGMQKSCASRKKGITQSASSPAV